MLKESVVTCVVCDVSIPRHMTYLFDNKKYPSLQHWQKVTIPQKYTKRYICKTCHEQLKKHGTSVNLVTVLPYYGNHKKVASGANFLKSLQEMPTYVCTCCHRLMFHKNV